MSVCLHGTAQLEMEGFLWNVIFDDLESMSKKIKFR